MMEADLDYHDLTEADAMSLWAKYAAIRKELEARPTTGCFGAPASFPVLRTAIASIPTGVRLSALPAAESSGRRSIGPRTT